jgi:hypothetical protein
MMNSAISTTASEVSPWNLILAHRYAEALSLYDRQRLRGTLEAVDEANRATALLCLGQLSEALDGFRLANDIATRKQPGETQPYLNDIGTVLWLSGNRTEALGVFRRSVDGVLDGSIQFADNAGGVTQGLLLWYAGVSIPDPSSTSDALQYLSGLLKKPRAKQWPGALAALVLDKITEESVMLEATSGASDLKHPRPSNLLARRQLVQVLFYAGVKARKTGDDAASRQKFRACAEMENPILQMEWYLARAEVGQSAEAHG